MDRSWRLLRCEQGCGSRRSPGLELGDGDEAESGGVDAVAQSPPSATGPSSKRWPRWLSPSAERTSVRITNSLRSRLLDDVRGLDRAGEARPAGSAVELVGRREQRLARDDVDVDAVVVVVPVLVAERGFGAVLLGDAYCWSASASRALRGSCGSRSTRCLLVVCRSYTARNAEGAQKAPGAGRSWQMSPHESHPTERRLRPLREPPVLREAFFRLERRTGSASSAATARARPPCSSSCSTRCSPTRAPSPSSRGDQIGYFSQFSELDGTQTISRGARRRSSPTCTRVEAELAAIDADDRRRGDGPRRGDALDRAHRAPVRALRRDGPPRRLGLPPPDRHGAHDARASPTPHRDAARSTTSRAAGATGRPSRRSCSRTPTCCCSTSRRTSSTSPASSGSRPGSATSRAPPSSSRTIGSFLDAVVDPHRRGRELPPARVPRQLRRVHRAEAVPAEDPRAAVRARVRAARVRGGGHRRPARGRQGGEGQEQGLDKQLSKIKKSRTPAPRRPDHHRDLRRACTSKTCSAASRGSARPTATETLFDDVSFEVRRGNRIVVLGANG